MNTHIGSFFLLSFALAAPLCHCNVPATLQNSLIKALPDNDVASPAVRRACQTADRIGVNKPKCMYMQRNRLLSKQQGSCGTDLLRASAQLSLCMTVRVLSNQTHSFKEHGTCASAYKW